jgi:hypothetical protein
VSEETPNGTHDGEAYRFDVDREKKRVVLRFIPIDVRFDMPQEVFHAFTVEALAALHSLSLEPKD